MNNYPVTKAIIALAEMFVLNNLNRQPLFTHDPPLEDDGRAALAMTFFVNLYVTNGGYERDGNTYHPEWERTYRKDLVVIITQYKQVFIGELISRNKYLFVDRRALEHHLDQFEFDNTSNHDSCWRSDGLAKIDSILYDGYKHCFEHVPEEHRPSMMEAGLDASLQEGLFGHPFAFCTVELERCPIKNKEGGTYFKRLKSVKFLRHTVTLHQK